MTCEAAAFLSAHSLGRASALGASLAELAGRGLFWEATESDELRDAYETARELKRLGGHLAHSPELAKSIMLVLRQANYSLIEVLRLARGADRTTVAHVFPTALLSGGAVQPPIAQAPEFADAHMHSGATLSLESLLELGMTAQAEFPRELRGVVAYDRFGQIFSLGTVYAAAVRVLQSRLAAAPDSEYRVSPIVSAALVAGTFWSDVRRIAVHSFTGEAGGSPMSWDDLASQPPQSPSRPIDARVEIQGVLDELLSHGPGTNVALGLVQALVLINGFLQSEHGEGLSAFVARFARVSAFRKLASAPQRSQTLTRAVADVFAGGVVAAEFRKTVDSRSGRSLQTEVLAELKDHLTAFDASGAFTRHPRGASMPISFRRESNLFPQSDQYSVKQLFPLDRHIALARTIVDTVDRWPGLAPLIAAVDVVGNELDEPNWVFIPALQEIRDGSGGGLCLTCHAGEHFSWPLQGIRSVGELIRPTRVVDRIGHALALDATCADFITGPSAPRFSARVVLEDLCWMTSAGVASGEAMGIADRLLSRFGMNERRLSFTDFVEAWEARRSVGGITERLGLGAGAVPPAELPGDYASQLRGPSLALALLLYRGRLPGFESLDGTLPDWLAREYASLNQSSMPVVAETVLGWIIEEGIVIEACPSSNLTLAGLPRPHYLPLIRWLREGATITISSDDPTHFSTRVAEEIEIARTVLSESEVARVVSDSLANCHPIGHRWDGAVMKRLAEAARDDAWGLVALS